MRINRFQLKILAITGMFLQHFATGFKDVLPLWIYYICNFLGGFTYPIMTFLMYEGYQYTRSFKKYIIRLLVFGLITQIPYSMYISTNNLNIFFSMILGLLLLSAHDQYGNNMKFKGILIVLGILSLYVDWSFLGIIMFYALAVAKGDVKKVQIKYIDLFIFVIFFHLVATYSQGEFSEYFVANIVFFIGSIVATLSIHLYNGKKGPGFQYFFYLFYPGHIIILYVLKTLLIK